eukprot:scaffold10821_cov199-Amphora_coffeaeformis.AAC.14
MEEYNRVKKYRLEQQKHQQMMQRMMMQAATTRQSIFQEDEEEEIEPYMGFSAVAGIPVQNSPTVSFSSGWPGPSERSLSYRSSTTVPSGTAVCVSASPSPSSSPSSSSSRSRGLRNVDLQLLGPTPIGPNASFSSPPSFEMDRSTMPYPLTPPNGAMADLANKLDKESRDILIRALLG